MLWSIAIYCLHRVKWFPLCFAHSKIISSIDCSIWPTNRTLRTTTTLRQSGFGSNNNDGILSIPKRSRNYLTTRLFSVRYMKFDGVSFPSIEMPSVFSTYLPDSATAELLKFSHYFFSLYIYVCVCVCVYVYVRVFVRVFVW